MKFKHLTVYVSTYSEGGLKARVKQTTFRGSSYGSDLLKHDRTLCVQAAMRTAIQKLSGLTDSITFRFETKLEVMDVAFDYAQPTEPVAFNVCA